MAKFETYGEHVCCLCVDLLVNADPHNIGFSDEEYAIWQQNADEYMNTYNVVHPGYKNITFIAENEESYWNIFGCPLCKDGLGTMVYPLTVLIEL